MGDTRKRSSIWLQYIDVGNNKAECLICENKISVKGGSTTNLHRHLRLIHPSVLLEDGCLPSGTSTNLTPSHRKKSTIAANTSPPPRARKKNRIKKRSTIWQHFTHNGNNRAQCHHCKMKITFKGATTTNLHRHLRTIHPTIQMDFSWRPASPSSDSGEILAETTVAGDASFATNETITSSTATRRVKRKPSGPKQMTQSKQQNLDMELAKMITTDFQRYSIVEDIGFKSFIKVLNPLYNLPSKKALSQTIIPKLYDMQREYWLGTVKNASSVCLTIDHWTAKGNCSFMSVSCHFIENFKLTSCLLDCFDFTDLDAPENLAKELLRVASEWQVDEKVVCCVADNSAQITTAIAALKWTHLPCLAHMLDQMVSEALNVVKPTLDKVNALVDFFHKSTEASQRLSLTQNEMGLAELLLKQDFPSKWISTLYMLKRLLETKNAIISALEMMALLEATVDALCPDEWELVKEVCAILQPFEEVTVELGANSYVPASKMLLLCKGLQRVTAQHHQTVTMQEADELVTALCSAMDQRFLGLEYNTVLSEATLLDPRFKRLAFSDNRAVDEAVQRISAAAATWTPSSQTSLETQSDEAQASVIWMLFDERATGDAARRNPTAEAQIEVRSYLDEPILHRAEDPLGWWQVKGAAFSRLAKVMEERLCIVATSVPAQRLFSKAGQTLIKRRSSISPSKLRHMTFLNANLH